jgi:membrane-associated protease RseP (regulator of RpoE activity)
VITLRVPEEKLKKWEEARKKLNKKDRTTFIINAVDFFIEHDALDLLDIERNLKMGELYLLDVVNRIKKLRGVKSG